MEVWTPLIWGSLCRITSRWRMMLDVWWGLRPRLRRPPLTMVWFHFRRVWLKGILIWGLPVIETWLPLLSHQGDSSDNWGSSSTSGIPPVRSGLSWIAVVISATFRAGIVISFTWPSAMTIAVGSDKTQKQVTTQKSFVNVFVLKTTIASTYPILNNY